VQLPIYSLHIERHWRFSANSHSTISARSPFDYHSTAITVINATFSGFTDSGLSYDKFHNLYDLVTKTCYENSSFVFHAAIDLHTRADFSSFFDNTSSCLNENLICIAFFRIF
jgi:hypothetical protein